MSFSGWGSWKHRSGAASRAVLCLVVAPVLTVLLPVARVDAAIGGDLDKSFSGDGKAFDGLAGSYEGYGVALQEDGKLVVAGEFGGDAAVARFKPDGSLDTTFSGDGVVVTDFGTTATHIEALAIAPNGRIVIVGWTVVTDDYSDNSRIAIARYTTSGVLDTTFRGDGKSNIEIGWDEEAHGVAVQPDGKIVVVGEDHVSFDDDFLVLRFETDGDLDPTFHGDGKVTTGFGGDYDSANDVVLQPDGKIVAAGRTDVDGFSDGDFAIARYTSTGSLDRGFHFDGKASTGFGANDGGLAVARQSDGKIVVGGWTGEWGSRNFALARYTTAGIADDSLDGDGKLTTSMGGDDLLLDLAIQPDGRIVAAGSRDDEFAVARYNSGGSLNTSFATDGRVVTDLGGNDGAYGVVVQDDGKIVAGGTSAGSTGREMALVRYHGKTDNLPSTYIDSGPDGITTSDSTPTFTFHSNEASATFQCAVDSGSFSSCTSPKTLSTLSEGSHTFRVRAVDSSAQTDLTPDTATFTVDTPPQTTIISGPSGPTMDPTPTFWFSSDEPGSTFSCAVDAGGFVPCTSPHTLAAQTDGPHTFSVRATDSDGTPNTDGSPAVRSFSVDATPPDTLLDSGPSGTITDSTPTLEFHSTEAGSFRCSLDGASATVCSSPKTIGPLIDGPHIYTITAVDAVGNLDPSPVTASFTVDTTAPNTTITADPGPLTRDPTPTFAFEATEPGSTFECSIDGAELTPCTSPYTSPVELDDGPHTFAVRATDSTAHVDETPAERAFTVDTVAPDTVITDGPSGTITTTTVTFSFGSLNEMAAGFQCHVDDQAWRSCTSPRTYQDLAQGDHVFRVRAKDAAGNYDKTPARRDFRIVAG